jgi:hypothetical protein
MPIFQNDTNATLVTALTNAVPVTIFVRLVMWNQSGGVKGTGGYLNTTGTVPPAGNYTVKIDFLEDNARYCVDYWAENTTLIYDPTTGPILPVKFLLFRQKSTDPTKTMRIRISKPLYNGGWPFVAAMPYNNSNVQKIITHQNQATNKKTQATSTIAYNIPERTAKCSGTLSVAEAVVKTTGKTSQGSYVSAGVSGCAILWRFSVFQYYFVSWNVTHRLICGYVYKHPFASLCTLPV